MEKELINSDFEGIMNSLASITKKPKNQTTDLLKLILKAKQDTYNTEFIEKMLSCYEYDSNLFQFNNLF